MEPVAQALLATRTEVLVVMAHARERHRDRRDFAVQREANPQIEVLEHRVRFVKSPYGFQQRSLNHHGGCRDASLPADQALEHVAVAQFALAPVWNGVAGAI